MNFVTMNIKLDTAADEIAPWPETLSALRIWGCRPGMWAERLRSAVGPVLNLGSLRETRQTLLHLGVLAFGLLQDGDVRIGVSIARG